MWVLFEGLDKVGKTTLERAFLKATDYKHIVIDRGPAGYATFDDILKRETPTSKTIFYAQAKEFLGLNSTVIFVTANEDTVNKRLEKHNEKQLETDWTYQEMASCYKLNVYRFYGTKNVITLDTSDKSIDECVQLIINRVNEVNRVYESN